MAKVKTESQLWTSLQKVNPPALSKIKLINQVVLYILLQAKEKEDQKDDCLVKDLCPPGKDDKAIRKELTKLVDTGLVKRYNLKKPVLVKGLRPCVIGYRLTAKGKTSLKLLDNLFT